MNLYWKPMEGQLCASEGKSFAVISDVHGNYKALEAFLAYIEEHPVNGIFCLGDYVTDSPYPQRTMELIYQMREKYPCYMVRGNREGYLLENAREDQHWKPSSSSGALYYTAQNLTDRDMQLFEGLPDEREVLLEGCPPVYICHGIPGKPRGNVSFDGKLREEALCAVPQNYVFGGHSHRQEIFHHAGKVYLNPGSLGLAIDGVGRRAQFAVVRACTADKSKERAEWTKAVDAVNAPGKQPIWDIQLLSIAYDVDSFLQDFAGSGLDEAGMVLSRAIRKTLVTGVNYFLKSIQEAEKAGRQQGVPVSQLPESIWQELGERLGL